MRCLGGECLSNACKQTPIFPFVPTDYLRIVWSKVRAPVRMRQIIAWSQLTILMISPLNIKVLQVNSSHADICP